jgi:hypothetical protein
MSCRLERLRPEQFPSCWSAQARTSRQASILSGSNAVRSSASLRKASRLSQPSKLFICGRYTVLDQRRSASESRTSILLSQEAQKSLDRTHQLREGFTVTRVQIDQAERDARVDAAMLDEVRAKLALLKAGSREEDITETRSRRDAAKRRVEEVSAVLGYCSVMPRWLVLS